MQTVTGNLRLIGEQIKLFGCELLNGCGLVRDWNVNNPNSDMPFFSGWGCYDWKPLDQEGLRLAGNWKAVLGESDYVGQAEVTSDWREGYGAMTVIEGTKVKR